MVQRVCYGEPVLYAGRCRRYLDDVAKNTPHRMTFHLCALRELCGKFSSSACSGDFTSPNVPALHSPLRTVTSAPLSVPRASALSLSLPAFIVPPKHWKFPPGTWKIDLLDFAL